MSKAISEIIEYNRKAFKRTSVTSPRRSKLGYGWFVFDGDDRLDFDTLEEANDYYNRRKEQLYNESDND